jgi:hypothetical protein
MSYRYKNLEKVLSSIAKDYSEENMRKQLATLTSDEIRKLRGIMCMAEVEMYDIEINEKAA